MCKKYLWEKLRGIKRITAMFLAAVLSVSTVSFMLPRNLVKAQAAGTGKNLQIGSSVLTPEMSVSYNTIYDWDSKNRVTTAQTVYYGGNGTQRWLVIGYNGTGAVGMSNTVTLFAENNLVTGQAYHDPSDPADRSNHYGTSDIKPVVAGYYGTLFTNEEKGIILKRTLATGGYSDNYNSFSDGISDASALDAYLWLLSTKEADLLKKDYRTASDFWWLRSPGSDANRAAVVGINSDVACAGYSVAYVSGVRPAFNLNLQSIIFTSAAAGGKSSGNPGADALREVAAYSGNEWKLTLLDDGSANAAGNGHAGFNATRTDLGTVTAGNAITVSYSGAKTGLNEYVSAILVSAANENTPLYYGRIANNSASSTGTDITIPSGLAGGDYKLKVFAEQYNGDNKTDLVSAFSTINVTVEAASSGSTPSTPSTSGGDSEDYFAELKSAINYAAALGGNQTVSWNRDCVLNYDIMKLLAESPSITLAFSYTYEGFDYTVTIPGRLAKFDPEIPIYGPLYLYGMYGGTVKKH